MRTLLIICIMVYAQAASAQLNETSDDLSKEERLEQLAESSESSNASSDDSDEDEQASLFARHPLNINSVQEAFSNFPFLQPREVESIIRYRDMCGDFISVYELQAVPGLTINVIRKIIPYIKIGEDGFHSVAFRDRWKNGERTFVIRPAVEPATSKGYDPGDTTASSKFMGNRLKLFATSSYRYHDLLQYGLTCEKDAGEPFTFKDGNKGFDFYSAHLFLRSVGRIKALAIGDYVLNLGQGLICWQGLGVNKSSSVINIKNQSSVIRPYHSTGEYNFNRGIALTVVNGRIETSAFVSLRGLSANLNIDPVYGEVVSSVQESGYHRTPNEISSKNNLRLLMSGGKVGFIANHSTVAVNFIHYRYSLGLLKTDEPYNLFTIRGREWYNGSLDYSFTFRNFHWFGEAAVDKHGGTAFLNGVIASLDGTLDLAVLQRTINARYQSIYGNAFTESSLPTNESGIYCGIEWKPSLIKVDLYADVFRFPWLRYRLDAPAYGVAYLAQLSYIPSKAIEAVSRFRWRNKPLNNRLVDEQLNVPEDCMLMSWRTTISFQVTRQLALRTRADYVWYASESSLRREAGFLQFVDVIYKPDHRWYNLQFRMMVFETDSYNTRLYAYENDVPLTSSTPAFFGKGARLCLNWKGNIRLPRTTHLVMQPAIRIAHSFNQLNPKPMSAEPQNQRAATDFKFQIILRTT